MYQEYFQLEKYSQSSEQRPVRGQPETGRLSDQVTFIQRAIYSHKLSFLNIRFY